MYTNFLFCNSTYNFFQVIYTNLYIQRIQIFKEHSLFKIYKISKNILNSIHSTYTIFFKMYTILNIQCIQIFNSIHSRNTIYKQCNFAYRMIFFFFPILYIQHTKIFNYCAQSCTFIVCNFTKNVQIFIFSNYRIFQRMYIILCI